MFNLFKPQKAYCVHWQDISGKECRDLIRARDAVHAWEKIRNEHPVFAAYCFSITEIQSEEFKEN